MSPAQPRVKGRVMPKIRLTMDLPVDPTHQALEGQVYDAEENEDWSRGAVRWWIKSNANGDRIGVLNREAEFVSNEREVKGGEGDECG